SIQAIPMPSHFFPTHQEDRYEVLITNTGAASSNLEPVVIVDKVTSVRAPQIEGRVWNTHKELECSGAAVGEEELRCETETELPPGGQIALLVTFPEEVGRGPVVNTVSVSGGGGP